jgi:hypothetical protein
LNGFTVQAKGSRQPILSSRWFRILFPFLIVLIMAGGALGFGAYRKWHESRQNPWIEADSRPTGATVLINSRVVGATPLRVDRLEEGIYALRFEKDTYEPVVRQVQLEKPGSRVVVELKPMSSGQLVVNVEPKRSEVLLDGILVGHTPLTLNAVAGPHELVVRRTNFKPFVRRVNLKPEETQTFEGVALEDLVLKAMRERRRMEPWRISNATELATYLFLSGHQKEAAEVTMQAIDTALNPPQFPPGMLPDDRTNEMRLRSDDMSRLNHMFSRMWSWPGHNTAKYRERMSKPDGSLKVLAFRLRLQSWERASSSAATLFAHHAKDSATLAAAVRLIADRVGRSRSRQHDCRPLVAMAEKMAKAAYAIDRSAGALAMAEVTALKGSYGEAANYLRESLSQQSPKNTWEDRALRAVTIYRSIGQLDQARSVCQRLVKSGRPDIQKAASLLMRKLQ